MNHAGQYRMVSLHCILAWVFIGACFAVMSTQANSSSINNAVSSNAKMRVAMRLDVANHDDVCVIVDLFVLKWSHWTGAELQSLSATIAREMGVLSVGGQHYLALPKEEGFVGRVFDGETNITQQGHDPAMSMISDKHYEIRIPVRCGQAREALVNGGSLVFDPTYRGMEYTSMLQSLSFQWATPLVTTKE